MVRQSPSLFSLSLQGLLLAFLCYHSLYFLRTPILELGNADYFLHGPNLIFHEAGHVLFGIFGKPLLTSFGGSLFQFLVPALLALAFIIKNRDLYATGIMAWWAGQNLVDVAPYINDARSLSLILIGGHTGREVEGHDWEFILTELDLLSRDIYIARDVLLAGRIVMILSLAIAALAICWALWSRQNRPLPQEPGY